MKNLATCTPSEFMRQTVLIRKAAEKWLTLTDILNIRKRMPEVTPATAEERKEAIREQALKNANAILTAVMEEHPAETLELLALVCFVEPKDVDNHPMSEYIGAINDLLSDEAVVGFFTSLARLGQMSGSK